MIVIFPTTRSNDFYSLLKLVESNICFCFFMCAITVEIVNGRIQKIPRPMNAFMLFAHENRKRMQLMFPELSNKEVSTK